MDKKDLNNSNSVAGEIMKEIDEIKTLQTEALEQTYTITVGCGGLWTLICC